jgi:hypothetical protein
MPISVQLRIEDQEVEDLLAYMQSRFADMWHGEKASIMERAIKILRMADDYETSQDPHCLEAIKVSVTEEVFPIHGAPTCKRP